MKSFDNMMAYHDLCFDSITLVTVWTSDCRESEGGSRETRQEAAVIVQMMVVCNVK